MKSQKIHGEIPVEFSLLADPEHKVIEKYGAWEKSMYGKKFMGIIRSFIIDEEGRLMKVFPKVSRTGMQKKSCKRLTDRKNYCFRTVRIPFLQELFERHF